MDDKIEFIADGFKLYGPKLDGGYNLTLYVGEYERQKLSKFLNLSVNQNYKITVEKYGEPKQQSGSGPEPTGATKTGADKGNSSSYPERVPGGQGWPSKA